MIFNIINYIVYRYIYIYIYILFVFLIALKYNCVNEMRCIYH